VALSSVFAVIWNPIWAFVGFRTKLPVVSHLSKAYPGPGTARKVIIVPHSYRP
jgi:hypothetical protein